MPYAVIAAGDTKVKTDSLSHYPWARHHKMMLLINTKMIATDHSYVTHGTMRTSNSHPFVKPKSPKCLLCASTV